MLSVFLSMFYLVHLHGLQLLPIPQVRVSSLHYHVSLWLWPIVTVGLWNTRSTRRQRKIMLPSEILTWWIMIGRPLQLSGIITSFDKYFQNDDTKIRFWKFDFWRKRKLYGNFFVLLFMKVLNWSLSRISTTYIFPVTVPGFLNVTAECC